MAIMSKVDISENPTKPELYNRIFSETGGIFDKFYDGDVEYDTGSHIFRNSDNIELYLDFLCNISYKMYEKNTLKLKKEEFQVPKLEFHGKFISVLEFPIKHLFESKEIDIEFIHKSIYEYFVAEYFFRLIKKSIIIHPSKEDLASVFGNFFKNDYLSSEIWEFLKYKIRNSPLIDEFEIIIKAFQSMLQNGMTFFTNKCLKNVIECEMIIFANMLEFIHIWKINNYLEFNKKICLYIRLNHIMFNSLQSKNKTLSQSDIDNNKFITKFNISLQNVNLSFLNLNRVNLQNVNLIGANLTGTDLSNSTLLGANLFHANLTRANLTKVDLRDSNLSDANLSETVLYGVNLKGANLNNSLWHIDDIPKIRVHIKNFNFEYIKVKDSSSIKIFSRSEFFKRYN